MLIQANTESAVNADSAVTLRPALDKLVVRFANQRVGSSTLPLFSYPNADNALFHKFNVVYHGTNTHGLQ